MRKRRLEDTYSTTPRYNTKAVVRDTGVPADTFRAWERRYGVPMPHRTDSSQRLYSERDVALIRWLRDRTAEGLTISQAVRMLQSDDTPPDVSSQPVAWQVLEVQLVDALLALDGPAADAVLSQAFAYYPLDEVCLKLIQPAFVRIGDGWHSGTVSVGQEHFATHFVRRKLQALLNVYDVVSGQATIVMACAPGEQHDLGLLVLALMLVRRGYRVIYLGQDVPAGGLVPVIEQVSADLVCLSATSEATFDNVAHVVKAVQQLKSPPLVVVGGQGAAFGTNTNGAFQLIAGDALSAVEQIVELLAERGTNTRLT